MIRILHTADLHLGAPFPSLGEAEERRQDDFLQTFERLLTLAIKNDVQLFVVAGDLFDSPRPDAELVGKVQAGIKRLADRGILTVLLPGTHDNTVGADSVYRRHEFPGAVLLSSPTVEEPVGLEVAGQEVYLYGFAYRSFVSDAALAGMARRKPEGIHIGLLHGSRQGSPEWEYRKKDLPFALATLQQWGLDYVALGHYHNFENLEAGGRLYACYPGSPEGKRFGENGPRFCALVTVEPGRATVEPLPVGTRVLDELTLDLSGSETLQAASEKIHELRSSDLLLRLTLTGVVEAPLDLKALHARTAGDFFHLEFVDKTHLFDSDFARRIETEETVRGVFVRRARQLMAEASPERRQVVEDAFREVLIRFQSFGGGAS
ncbi:metallophosphoesterase family protein [Trichloromonas sp.]|uniref:metallophosphoesterase family protein n=1 Tax=Trichloromonas sp. TaxID=3069249 RepID=UPI003D812970